MSYNCMYTYELWRCIANSSSSSVCLKVGEYIACYINKADHPHERWLCRADLYICRATSGVAERWESEKAYLCTVFSTRRRMNGNSVVLQPCLASIQKFTPAPNPPPNPPFSPLSLPPSPSFSLSVSLSLPLSLYARVEEKFWGNMYIKRYLHLLCEYITL